MSYDILKNPDGEVLIMTLELPMFDGNESDLGRQAEVSLASFLRHAAVCEYIDSTFGIDDNTLDGYSQEYAQAAAQLATLLMSLSGMANLLGIDIMEEIWEMPWSV